MPIILSSLDKAIISLDKAVKRSILNPDDEEVRDAKLLLEKLLIGNHD